MMPNRAPLRLAYLSVTNACALLRLLPRSDRDKDAEILALRHQLAVLQRQNDVEGVAGFAAGLGNVERVDVLPFHRLGAAKYDRLGIPFALRDTPPPDPGLIGFITAGLPTC